MRYAISLLVIALLLGKAQQSLPKADPTPLGIPFQRYTTEDSFGRTITFYLSAPRKGEDSARRPVVLFIQGSGCQSLFFKHGEWMAGGIHLLLLEEAKGRARILVVEKPGVKFLDNPAHFGSALDGSEEFLKEHTLPRWAEANLAALRAVWTLPDIDPTRSLMVGHSEGGIVAAMVSAESPRVTHVASLAGGGPTQLFDLAEIQRSGVGDNPGAAERHLQNIRDEWEKIRKDPDSISKFWMGHPYRRWSSFLKHSVTEELLRTKAKIYVAQGTLDTAVSVKAHDVLVAELRARGRDVTAERIEGADHGFQVQNMPQGAPDGMQALFGRLLSWFMAAEAKAKY